MTNQHSTVKLHPYKPAKPEKPYPEFPLGAANNGQWQKKIRGRIHYFGVWADPDGALELYNKQKDFLHAGLPVPVDREEATLKNICNKFMLQKKALVASSELSVRTLQNYHFAVTLLSQHFSPSQLITTISVEQFNRLRNTLSMKYGPGMLSNIVQTVRSILKFAYDTDLVEKPVKFGPDFKRANKKAFRQRRFDVGPKFYKAGEIKRMLAVASPQMKAMTLLGINCGFGNSDCGNLPISALDLDAGVVNYPRPKTGVERRCFLWPETVQALRDVLAARGTVEGDAAGLMFVTKFGKSWAKDSAESPITKEFGRIFDKLLMSGNRRGFYALRHTFRTVADECRDQPAVDHCMGHESGHISSHYREGISDDRLQAVANYVHQWLFTKTEGK